jgi:hypothetical protein
MPSLVLTRALVSACMYATLAEWTGRVQTPSLDDPSTNVFDVRLSGRGPAIGAEI